MIFETQTKTIFVPEVCGNKKKEEKEQIKVHIKRPSIEERQALTQVEMLVNSDDTKKKKDIKNSFRVENNTGRILRNHVTLIENVQIKDSESGKINNITTGEELAKVQGAFGLRALVEEICAEVLRDELEEEEEGLKNF